MAPDQSALAPSVTPAAALRSFFGSLLAIYRRALPACLLAGAAPALVVLITVASEYVLRRWGTFTGAEDGGIAATFSFLLHGLRLVAACTALVSWTWCIGAVMYDGQASSAEALRTGWTRGIVLLIAALPLWLVSLAALYFVAAVARLGWEVYLAVGLWAALLSQVFVASIAAPVLALAAGKLALLIPIATFEPVRALEALRRAFSRLSWRSFSEVWPITIPMSLGLLCTVLAPCWCFVTSLWGVLGQQAATPALIALGQCAAVALALCAGPLALSFVTGLYFTLAPLDVDAEPEEAPADQPAC